MSGRAEMFRDFVVPLTGTSGDAEALDAAVDAARAFGAHLSVLVPVSLPLPAGLPWGLAPQSAVGDVFARLQARAEIEAARVRARLAGEAIASDVRIVEALFVEPGRLAAHHTHHADLAIVAGVAGSGPDAQAGQAWFAAMLLESGRPVLAVPPGRPSAAVPERILVAWRPTQEAARALHDAMPLLRRAVRVEVLAVGAGAADAGAWGAGVGEVATHLARHGVRADAAVRDPGARGVGGVLVDHARATGAQLIVAGGYGHARQRGWTMGGVTGELLATSPVPVLFSH